MLTDSEFRVTCGMEQETREPGKENGAYWYEGEGEVEAEEREAGRGVGPGHEAENSRIFIHPFSQILY
jgi:hypothetical protein